MTNDELDRARAVEAARIAGVGCNPAIQAARLARENWTPPVAVDPDIAEAEKIYGGWGSDDLPEVIDVALAAIKRGRELERAEAKPGLVWVKHDGSVKSPVALSASVICRYVSTCATQTLILSQGNCRDWLNVTHYAIITPPEKDAA